MIRLGASGVPLVHRHGGAAAAVRQFGTKASGSGASRPAKHFASVSRQVSPAAAAQASKTKDVVNFGFFKLHFGPGRAKFFIGGLSFVISGLISGLVIWYRYSVCPVDFESIETDLKYIFNKRPHLKSAVLHLMFMQNAAHTAGMENNVTSANTASIRYALDRPEYAHLRDVVLDMEKVATSHSNLSYSDLWALAACVAIEEMGGPSVVQDYAFGRVDQSQSAHFNEPELLPQPSRHGETGCLRHVVDFGRMGVSLQECVALMGAHTVGRKHVDRTGYDGAATTTEETFNNEYYNNLLKLTWVSQPPEGDRLPQYRSKEALVRGDESVHVTMLPADVALLYNKQTRELVKKYAADQDAWFHDFRLAWKRFSEVNFDHTVRGAFEYSDVAQRSAFIFASVATFRFFRDRWEGKPMTRPTQAIISTDAVDSISYARRRLVEILEADKEEKPKSWWLW